VSWGEARGVAHSDEPAEQTIRRQRDGTCPHIVTGVDGTSHCDLAEQHCRLVEARLLDQTLETKRLLAQRELLDSLIRRLWNARDSEWRVIVADDGQNSIVSVLNGASADERAELRRIVDEP